MPISIHPQTVNHMNVVAEDFEAGVAQIRRLFGSEVLKDLPGSHWHACLVEVGRVIFEIFAPADFFLNSRHGPHYLGLEYQADMGEVRQALAEHGIRIARDIGSALHTHPADCHGIAFEFWSESTGGEPELVASALSSADGRCSQRVTPGRAEKVRLRKVGYRSTLGTLTDEEFRESLRSAFAKNPYMKLFVASGYYDFATPYFGTDYTLNHMRLDPSFSKNVTSEFYEAGHMMYIDLKSMAKLKKDIDAFIQKSLVN